MKENKITFSTCRSGLRCANRTSHLPLSGHMLLCVRNRGGLRDVLRGWGEGGGTQTGRTVRNRSPSASLFAAFTQGAVVGGGGPRRNNVSFHPPHPNPSPTSPSFAYKVRSACRTVLCPDALAHAVRLRRRRHRKQAQ